MRGCNGSLLRGQDQVIKFALCRAEFAVSGKRACDVAGIAIKFTAGIDQNQIATQNRRGISAVVQHTGIGTAGHNRAISRILGAVLAKFVEQLGVQMVFTDVLPCSQHACRSFHCTNVSARTDLRCAAHDVQFMCVFDQTHFIQNAAHIALLLWAQCAVAHARANCIEACFNARRQVFVCCKGVPNDRLVFKQGRQFGIKG